MHDDDVDEEEEEEVKNDEIVASIQYISKKEIEIEIERDVANDVTTQPPLL